MIEFFQEVNTFLINFKIDTVIKIYNKWLEFPLKTDW